MIKNCVYPPPPLDKNPVRRDFPPGRLFCRGRIQRNLSTAAPSPQQQQQNRNLQIMIQAEEAPQLQQQVVELMHYRQWEMLAAQQIDEVWEPYQD